MPEETPKFPVKSLVTTVLTLLAGGVLIGVGISTGDDSLVTSGQGLMGVGAIPGTMFVRFVLKWLKVEPAPEGGTVTPLKSGQDALKVFNDKDQK